MVIVVSYGSSLSSIDKGSGVIRSECRAQVRFTNLVAAFARYVAEWMRPIPLPMREGKLLRRSNSQAALSPLNLMGLSCAVLVSTEAGAAVSKVAPTSGREVHWTSVGAADHHLRKPVAERSDARDGDATRIGGLE